MFTFQLVLGQGAYWEVFWYHANHLLYWWLLCSRDVWSFGGNIFVVVFKWLSNPILYSSLLSQARIPIRAAPITNKTLASSSIRLMQFEFPNIEKKWNTVQSSLSCRSHQFIWMDFIHLSIVPFLTSSGWKNINCCSCVGIEKFWLPIRQCIFLILAMVNKKIRGNYI